MVTSAWEWLFGPDPGLLRLWMAGRVVVTAAMTLTALLLLQHVITVPIDAIGLGLMVSIFASVNVRDPTPPQQRITLLLMPVPALASWAAAASLNRWSWLADCGFVAIVFCAGLARLQGSRGAAFGMIAYISYFIGEVTRSQLSHYTLALLAIAIAVTAAYLSRFHVIAHSPAATLNRVQRHLRRRIARILDEIASSFASGEWDDAGRTRLRRELTHLREEALTAKQQIDSLADGAGPDTTASQTCAQVFALELAAERLARVALQHLPPSAEREALHRRVLRLSPALSGDCSPSWGNPAAPGDPISRALDALETTLTSIPTFPVDGSSASTSQPTADCSPGGEQSLLAKPGFRQALQNALSVGLAVGFGSLLSGRRWYWAAIAAFIVGIGVASRSEGVVKALQRLVGTVVGIVVGLYFGSLVSGHTNLTLGLVLVCIFVAFYAFQAAYGIMMFWITIMVALLYSLLGLLSSALLLLRLEETAIGSAIGVAVMITLLPVRTHEVLAASLADLVAAVASVVKYAACDPFGSRNATELIAAGWQVAQKTSSLRDAIGPVKRGWERLSPTGPRIALGIAEDLAYFARELAYVAAADQRRLSELNTMRAKLHLLRCEFEDYCKTIKVAGTNFHCRKAPETQAGEDASAAFFDGEALLDMLSRELGRLRATCTGSAPRSEAAQ